MTYRISVDTGGTFTDVVVERRGGQARARQGADDTRARLRRAPRRHRPGRGAHRALGRGAAGADRGAHLRHDAGDERDRRGQDRAHGVLHDRGLPRHPARCARAASSTRSSRSRTRPPYVPRRLTFEIRERIDAEGDVVRARSTRPASSRDRRGARELRARGGRRLPALVDRQPGARAARRRADRARSCPGVPYTLSHQLNPIVREYRRASSTAIDASLKPLMQAHLRRWSATCGRPGFARRAASSPPRSAAPGGPHEVVERPIYSVGSGPSMAPVAALTYAPRRARRGGGRDLIVCDTGGTSFDVGLVRGGRVNYATETWLGGRWIGHITGIRSVDVKSIGAGGGSIAWIDPGGLLRVGPQSAGADPGPACYGRGGTRADGHRRRRRARLHRPRLLPRRPDDARRRRGARGALGRLAGAARASTCAEAAHAALTIATENMVGAIQEITIAQGVDPREVLAGRRRRRRRAEHRPDRPRARLPRRCCSRAPPARSRACGGAVLGHHLASSRAAATRRRARSTSTRSTRRSPTSRRAPTRSSAALAGRRPGRRRARSSSSRPATARRSGSSTSPLAERALARTSDVARAARSVPRRRTSGSSPCASPASTSSACWKVRATGRARASRRCAPRAPPSGAAEPARVAPAYFRETGRRAPCPATRAARSPRGARIEGPALDRRADDDRRRPPGLGATVTRLGNYLLERDVDAATADGGSRGEPSTRCCWRCIANRSTRSSAR